MNIHLPAINTIWHTAICTKIPGNVEASRSSPWSGHRSLQRCPHHFRPRLRLPLGALPAAGGKAAGGKVRAAEVIPLASQGGGPGGRGMEDEAVAWVIQIIQSCCIDAWIAWYSMTWKSGSIIENVGPSHHVLMRCSSQCFSLVRVGFEAAFKWIYSPNKLTPRLQSCGWMKFTLDRTSWCGQSGTWTAVFQVWLLLSNCEFNLLLVQTESESRIEEVRFWIILNRNDQQMLQAALPSPLSSLRGWHPAAASFAGRLTHLPPAWSDGCNQLRLIETSVAPVLGETEKRPQSNAGDAMRCDVERGWNRMVDQPCRINHI